MEPSVVSKQRAQADNLFAMSDKQGIEFSERIKDGGLVKSQKVVENGSNTTNSMILAPTYIFLEEVGKGVCLLGQLVDVAIVDLQSPIDFM